jgi:hypothetical protein
MKFCEYGPNCLWSKHGNNFHVYGLFGKVILRSYSNVNLPKDNWQKSFKKQKLLSKMGFIIKTSLTP